MSMIYVVNQNPWDTAWEKPHTLLSTTTEFYMEVALKWKYDFFIGWC